MARTGTAKGRSTLSRPAPPAGLEAGGFSPAPELEAWVTREIVTEGGALHNPDHQHLASADLEFLWAAEGFVKAGRHVLGQAEQVMFRAGGWQKMRQEQQMIAWFGRVPDFLITLAADYCAQCSDLEFCALVEHELYHVAHKRDDFGAPAFTREGMPKIGIQGHDVEEFVGVVRRYGASSDVLRLVDAATKPAEVAQLNIARACGTCLLKSA